MQQNFDKSIVAIQNFEKNLRKNIFAEFSLFNFYFDVVYVFNINKRIKQFVAQNNENFVERTFFNLLTKFIQIVN